MQAPRYLKGVSRSLLDNELKSTGSDLYRMWAIMFPTSSTRDGKRQFVLCEISEGGYTCRGQLLLNISAAQWRIWQYLGVKWSEVVTKGQWADEWPNRITQTHGGKSEVRWDVPTQTRMQTVPCSRATYCRWRRLRFLYFPHHFWRVPRLFLDDKLDGDSICLESVISTEPDVIKF